MGWCGDEESKSNQLWKGVIFKMKKILMLLLVVVMGWSLLSGCQMETGKTGTGKKDSKDTLIFAWYPNESGVELKAARDEIGQIIEEATGKKVDHKTTTDYLIAIEAVVNGNADLAFFGAEGYVQAHKKNDKILPLVVASGKSGTLEDAVYYSWLNVKKGNENQYRDGNKYSIDQIVGKRFSFVSNSSTSGFRVPSSGIKAYFSQKDEYKDLTVDDLIEGGKFFSEVLYGGSHQGSAVNLLKGSADVAAFCDVCVANYVELASGEANRPGAIYRVKEGAAEPFDKLSGAKFVVISVTAVLNAPFVVNTETVSAEEIKALKAALTSDEVANNQKIFVPKGADFTGMFPKKKDERFVDVKDAWFQPIRDLSGE